MAIPYQDSIFRTIRDAVRSYISCAATYHRAMHFPEVETPIASFGINGRVPRGDLYQSFQQLRSKRLFLNIGIRYESSVAVRIDNLRTARGCQRFDRRFQRFEHSCFPSIVERSRI